MNGARSLTDVPEEGASSSESTSRPPSGTGSQLQLPSSSTSSSPLAEKKLSSRILSGGREREREQQPRSSSSSSTRSTSRRAPFGSSQRATSGTSGSSSRYRSLPRMPHDRDAELASATIMYWSPAPVYGTLPRGLRAFSATMVDSVAWIFGGCDDKGTSFRDIYCFDTETMQWSHPETIGDVPKPCRAHTATLVENKKIVIFGGGQGGSYYDDTYILNTLTRKWTKPEFEVIPAQRRAHAAVLYKSKVWVFGGGNGMQALNDVWTLELNAGHGGMVWTELETHGRKPAPRGYHTASLIGNVMVIVGGSDGKECFSDVWCLNLDTLVWSSIKLEKSHRRLSHSATQVGSYLFIVGGHDGSNYVSETLMFNLVSLQYEPRITNGKPPSPRGYHVSMLADSRLFVLGGFNGYDVFDDVYLLDLAAAAYLPQVMSFRIDEHL